MPVGNHLCRCIAGKKTKPFAYRISQREHFTDPEDLVFVTPDTRITDEGLDAAFFSLEADLAGAASRSTSEKVYLDDVLGGYSVHAPVARALSRHDESPAFAGLS